MNGTLGVSSTVGVSGVLGVSVSPVGGTIVSPGVSSILGLLGTFGVSVSPVGGTTLLLSLLLLPLLLLPLLLLFSLHGDKVGFELGHAQLVAYYVQQGLVIVQIGYRDTCHDSKRPEYMCREPSVFL